MWKSEHTKQFATEILNIKDISNTKYTLDQLNMFHLFVNEAMIELQNNPNTYNKILEIPRSIVELPLLEARHNTLLKIIEENENKFQSKEARDKVIHDIFSNNLNESIEFEENRKQFLSLVIKLKSLLNNKTVDDQLAIIKYIYDNQPKKRFFKSTKEHKYIKSLFDRNEYKEFRKCIDDIKSMSISFNFLNLGFVDQIFHDLQNNVFNSQDNYYNNKYFKNNVSPNNKVVSKISMLDILYVTNKKDNIWTDILNNLLSNDTSDINKLIFDFFVKQYILQKDNPLNKKNIRKPYKITFINRSKILGFKITRKHETFITITEDMIGNQMVDTDNYKDELNNLENKIKKLKEKIKSSKLTFNKRMNELKSELGKEEVSIGDLIKKDLPTQKQRREYNIERNKLQLDLGTIETLKKMLVEKEKSENNIEEHIKPFINNNSIVYSNNEYAKSFSQHPNKGYSKEESSSFTL